jgi:hypothetical protein
MKEKLKPITTAMEGSQKGHFFVEIHAFSKAIDEFI